MISVVLPCYKDAAHLLENVERIVRTLELLVLDFEVILVNDASPDETGAVAEEICARDETGRVRVLHHSENRGRGAAFLTGVRAAQGEIVGFLDVDLEVSPVYIVECVRRITQEDADLVIGQRHYRVEFGLRYRHILSRGYALLVSWILGLPRSLDSESGYKFFRRDVLETYLDSFEHMGWFWDTEVVSRFYWDGRVIASVPCLFLRNSDKASTVNPFRDSIDYCRHLLGFWLRRRYRRPVPIVERPQQDLPQKAA